MSQTRSSCIVRFLPTRALRAGSLACAVALAPTALPATFVPVAMSPAHAEIPYTYTNSLVDQSGVLTKPSELRTAIEALARDKGIKLHVVIVSIFQFPSDSAAWAMAVAKKNNWGADDVLLAIASDSREVYFYSPSDKYLSPADLESITRERIRPQIWTKNWDGAVQGAIEGARVHAKTAPSDNSADSDPTDALLDAGLKGSLAVALAASGYLYYRRSKERSEAKAPFTPQGAPNPDYSVEALSAREIKKYSTQALLTIDDDMERMTQQADYARAQYGDETIPEIDELLSVARELAKTAHHHQGLLKETKYNNKSEVHRFGSEIIDNALRITAISRDMEGELERIQALAQDAPSIIERISSMLPQIEAQSATARDLYAQLSAHYSPSVLESVAQIPEQLDVQNALLHEELKSAQMFLPRSSATALPRVRAAQNAAQEIAALLDRLDEFKGTQEQAQQSLETAILALRRDIAQAIEYGDSELLLLAHSTDSELKQIRSQAQARPNDPVTLNKRVETLSEELGEVIRQVERVREAKAQVGPTISKATKQIQLATTFAQINRWLSFSTYQALLSAEQEIAEAKAQASTDPILALSSAESALAQALRAQELAEEDAEKLGLAEEDSSLSAANVLLAVGSVAASVLSVPGGSSSRSSSSSSSGWSSSSRGSGDGGSF